MGLLFHLFSSWVRSLEAGPAPGRRDLPMEALIHGVGIADGTRPHAHHPARHAHGSGAGASGQHHGAGSDAGVVPTGLAPAPEPTSTPLPTGGGACSGPCWCLQGHALIEEAVIAHFGASRHDAHAVVNTT